jgi:hypothetical protein
VRTSNLIESTTQPAFVKPKVHYRAHKCSSLDYILGQAVPWMRSLVAGLSPRRPGFAPGSIHMGFVVDKVSLGQVFLRVLRFYPVNISFHRRSPNSYHLGNA